MTEPFALAQHAASVLVDRLGGGHVAGIVLGSGWGDALDRIGDVAAEMPITDLPGFPAPTVPGHHGRIVSVDSGGTKVYVLQGRVHLYEGHEPSAVVHGVRTMAAAGIGAVVLTNAAGSLNPDFGVGTPVLLSDHINLTGTSPLVGPMPPAPHDFRFVDLIDAYSPRLRGLARASDDGVREGVYAGLLGPNFETPAEIMMLRTMGADLVGMSTVLECIAARHVGLEVMGMSLVTNLAAGLSASLDHSEVLAAGQAAGARVGAILRAVVDGI